MKGRKILIVFVCVTLIFSFYCRKMDLSPAVEEILRILTEVTTVFVLSYVTMFWLNFNQRLIGVWSGAVCITTKRARRIKLYRALIKFFFGVIKPIPGPSFFICYCFNNSDSFEKLKTDVIIVFVAAVLWILFERNNLFRNYKYSLAEEKRHAWDSFIIIDEDKKYIKGTKLFMALLIPVFLILLNIVIFRVVGFIIK